MYAIAHKNIWWGYLSTNPYAIPILEQNLDNVIWFWLSRNPNAILIIEKNLDKIDWDYLSGNPNAIHLLFKYDYSKMKSSINEELVEPSFQRYVNGATPVNPVIYILPELVIHEESLTT